MISIYPACFFKDETGYSVVFPDLNWLATNGSTETEAMNMAVDVWPVISILLRMTVSRPLLHPQWAIYLWIQLPKSSMPILTEHS